MTPLLRLVTPSAMRGPASSNAKLCPRAAKSDAAAQPTTPAPTIATSTSVCSTAQIAPEMAGLHDLHRLLQRGGHGDGDGRAEPQRADGLGQQRSLELARRGAAGLVEVFGVHGGEYLTFHDLGMMPRHELAA